MDIVYVLIALVVTVFAYFIPTFVAWQRGIPSNKTCAIFFLNLIGGWTGFAWLGALIWAIAAEKENKKVWREG